MHSHSLLGRDVTVYHLAYEWGQLLNPVVILLQTRPYRVVESDRPEDLQHLQSLADVFCGSRAI
jgi:hypothetical protein